MGVLSTTIVVGVASAIELTNSRKTIVIWFKYGAGVLLEFICLSSMKNIEAFFCLQLR
jgi:hypothetical protein